jgi:hypothetical protein
MFNDIYRLTAYRVPALRKPFLFQMALRRVMQNS